MPCAPRSKTREQLRTAAATSDSRSTLRTLLATILSASAIWMVMALAPTSAQAQAQAQAEVLPALPEGVDPLPEERRQTLAPLVAQAERYRGLEAGDELPIGIQTKEALGRHLDQELRDEVPAELAPLADRVIEIFGFIPGEVDLLGELRKLLGEQVAGYFDPETGYLVIVESGTAAAAEAAGVEAAEAATMADAVMVHEIGHYLQDRYFDLETMMKAGKGDGDDERFFSDQAGALAALIEGDATHLMFSHMMGMHLERIPGFAAGIGQMLTDPDALAGMSPDLAGDQAMAEAPTFLREEMIFPYMNGLLFVTAVRQEGGQALLDHAFARDVPRSTEQILHPEKWLGDAVSGRRDTPVEIDLPEVESLLGERRLMGTWGELDLRIGLRIRLGDDQRQRAEEAAEGWGGDVFALYGGLDGQPESLAWISEWDTKADAEEFAAVVREIWGDAPLWRIGAAGTRVVMLYGTLPPENVQPVERALFGTRARRAIEPAIDLVALGIDAATLPGPAGPGEVMAAMTDSPFGQAMGGDLSDLEPPEGLDVEAMFEDPEFREMAAAEAEKALAAMKDLGPLPVESKGKTHRLPTLGFELKAPGSGWSKFDLDQFPGEPKPTLMLTTASGAVAVVTVMPSPMAAPIEAVIGGMRMSMPGFEMLEQTKLEGETWGYELDYTFEQDGTLLRVLHHYYHLHGSLLSVQAMARDELWPQTVPSLRAMFDSIRFVEPASEADR